MSLRVLALFAAALTAHPACVDSFTRRGNITLLHSTGGLSEIEWLSTSSFRFQRCLGLACASEPQGGLDPVDFEVGDNPAVLDLETEYVSVNINKADCSLTVKTQNNELLLEQLPGEGIFSRRLLDGERLAGLGSHAFETMDLRGKRLSASIPLLISSKGFGQYFPNGSGWTFDLGAAQPGRLTVTGPPDTRLEHFFYYGPAPKEILEEHRAVAGSIEITPDHLGLLARHQIPSYAAAIDSPALIRKLQHASMSGVLAPVVDASKAPPALAPVMPLVTGRAPLGFDQERRALTPYLLTYLQEASDRAVPIVRPLAMQFPADEKAWRETGAFQLGDELLIAAESRFYLPQGLWTNMRTGVQHRGRQPLEGARVGDRFARNGTIVPLDLGTHMELHYFPRLGAEFFLTEPGHDNISQFHAAPALGLLRLEIESQPEREYEWVVHHANEPLEVAATNVTLATGATRFDKASAELRIRLRAAAGSDAILNIKLTEPFDR